MSESALSWRRGNCRISRLTRPIWWSNRAAKTRPYLVCCLCRFRSRIALRFSFRLVATHLCRCEHLVRGHSVLARVSRPNLNARSRVLGWRTKAWKLCSKPLGRLGREIYSEYSDGVTIDSEVAWDKALFYSLWQDWHSMAKTLPRL